MLRDFSGFHGFWKDFLGIQRDLCEMLRIFWDSLRDSY